MPVYMVVRGGQRPMLVSSSITLLTFVVSLSRIVISLNSEINNSNTLADQHTLGILLSPPSKC